MMLLAPASVQCMPERLRRVRRQSQNLAPRGGLKGFKIQAIRGAATQQGTRRSGGYGQPDLSTTRHMLKGIITTAQPRTPVSHANGFKSDTRQTGKRFWRVPIRQHCLLSRRRTPGSLKWPETTDILKSPGNWSWGEENDLSRQTGVVGAGREDLG